METNTTLNKIPFFDEFTKDSYIVKTKDLLLDTIRVQGVLKDGVVSELSFLVKRVKDKCVVIPMGDFIYNYVKFMISGERIGKVTAVETKAKSYIASKNKDGYITFEFVEENE